MTDCIVNIISGKAFIQFDQVIANGVVLVFSDIKSLLKSQEIWNTNSIKLVLPDSTGKISIHIFFGRNEIIKKINVLSKQNL